MFRRRVQVNVSGGRTSAYMAWWMKENLSNVFDMQFVFANTGQEHEDTLRFLADVDKKFGLGLVCLEAVVHSERKGTTHKIVPIDQLSRNGEPYRDVCSKYGVANVSFPHCTREMKANVLHSYTKPYQMDIFNQQ